ncbi:MAG: bifunctional adenosylcobinamide kinase/adenosylcobinamide-phosphate guanylyltransferase [Candidatus Hodgkinia cicadicola]
MLVLGGEKSGKSAFARHIAGGYTGVLHLVTMITADSRLHSQHINLRPIEWDVLEEPIALAYCLRQFSNAYNLIILDDISVWLSNVIALKLSIYHEVDCVIEALQSLRAKLVLSKELGLGVLPNNLLTSNYVNLLSCVNQLLANALSSVYFVIAGQALKIK